MIFVFCEYSLKKILSTVDWKALDIPDYPVKLEKQCVKESGTTTRACTKGRLVESGNSCTLQKTCLIDAIRLWNKLPSSNTYYLSHYFFNVNCQKRKQTDI